MILNFLKGVPANTIKELKDARDDKSIGDLIREISCHEWKIRLMAKSELINYERRLQYQIIRCTRLDFAAESRCLLETLKAYELA